MEADEAVLVVGLEYQENDRRDKGEVGQRTSHIIGKSGSSGCNCGRARTLRGGAGTLRTVRSIRNLRSTGWTESHGSLLCKTTGTLSERSPERNGAGSG